MPFFRRNSSLLQIVSAPNQVGNLLFLSKRSARKKLYNFPSKLNHLCRTSRHVWLSSSVCDRCCAYQLICIMTISTYATGARAYFFTLQEPNKRVISAHVRVISSSTYLKRSLKGISTEIVRHNEKQLGVQFGLLWNPYKNRTSFGKAVVS